MKTLLFLYLIPFIICILFAKFERDFRLDRNHLIKCAMIPIGNIITALTVIYEVLKKLVK